MPTRDSVDKRSNRMDAENTSKVAQCSCAAAWQRGHNSGPPLFRYVHTNRKELLGAFGQRDELRIEHLADRIDRISSSMDHEITVRRLDTLTHLIHAVQSALLRIKEGSYGFCEQCKSQIQPK